MPVPDLDRSDDETQRIIERVVEYARIEDRAGDLLVLGKTDWRFRPRLQVIVQGKHEKSKSRVAGRPSLR
ncbi:MAG TPA: hypothetical protein VJV79_33700 [Polyangiaceae bacterium]|nr:hypothetical protein [Polyangiaceae bacterium]